ncbi:MAG: DUF2064 domain-containing protein [Planctomycetota bacterium]
MTPPPLPRLIVMAKPPVPGRVKTRLTVELSPRQAAAVHAAMFATLAARLDRFVRAGDATLTLSLAVPTEQLADRDAFIDDAFADYPVARDALLAADFDLVTQGSGDLGQRILHAWHATEHQGPPSGAVVFGVDSPDLPEAHLRAALAVASPADPSSCPADHQAPDAAIGPTGDGGYWTLAAPQPPRPLLVPETLPASSGPIDWGTPAVYDQSHENARAAGLHLVDLPAWHDVDTPDDLRDLRRRLVSASDLALRRLADQLEAIQATPD